MRRRWLLFVASFLAVVPSAPAGPITYHVTVNTSSISGTSGSLDFNFIPGPLVTQSASLQILNFTTDGALAGSCACSTGDVSGQLPAAMTFDNGTGFNDYSPLFTFGTTISFDVSLYGPALSAPDGASTSGSAFAFSMFFDPVGTFPVLTSDTVDGLAFTVGVNLDGTTTATNFSTETAVPNSLTGQAITFGTLSNQPLGTAPFAVSATASSGLAVSFASASPGVCSVSGSTVTLVAIGTCSIQATQGGNNIWAAASPAAQNFQVLSTCDLKQNGSINVADVQLMINEALGGQRFERRRRRQRH